ncbi:hypothetical protein PITCH_A1150011 [uncultured Desulfobacterium sp.]|uniref:Uncharacterized protein n=1 Tax=uncultured Desulfobacterium sp. TaxID=201089 RepID=A0A445MRA5_9BACT|nr:hypothetical protein PITCH_A1150011 [uncultured Desulfobacterium sp.]
MPLTIFIHVRLRNDLTCKLNIQRFRLSQRNRNQG